MLEPLSLNQPQKAADRHYFPNLDGLRLIAALVVVPGHVEAFKGLFGVAADPWLPIAGKLGVILFFVLSGFLITNLLLREKEKTEDVSLRKFYLRRMLRIWPLYYLILLLAIFVANQLPGLRIAPSENLTQSMTLFNIAMFALILPNFATYVIPYAGQVWSIGIEEQFYFFQPIIVKCIRSVKVVAGLFVLLVAAPEIYKSAVAIAIDSRLQAPYGGVLFRFYYCAVYFGCLAIGSLAGVLVYRRSVVLDRVLFRRDVQVVTYLGLLYILPFNHIHGYMLDSRVYALWFAVIIVNLAANPGTVVSLEQKWLAHFGRRSYGIYMYHPVCIGVVLYFIVRLFGRSQFGTLENVVCYVAVIGLTLAVSSLSYTHFEKRFLKLKSRL